MAAWEEPDNEKKPWRERYGPYTTSMGVLVRPLHYRMVPSKDPDRLGLEWHDRERGTTPKRVWDREQEIMFGVAEGGLVYKQWSSRIHHLIEGLPLHPDWFYYTAIDPGVGVTAAIWYAITHNGWHLLIDEYYAGDQVPNSDVLSATGHAEAIKNRTQVLCDRSLGLTKGGSSRKDGQIWVRDTLIDPSAFRKDPDLSKVGERYVDAGITSLTEAARDIDGGIERVKELELLRPNILHPNGLADDGRGFPIKYSYPHLVNYYKEKKYYRYKPGTEKPVDKRDHLMDCERWLAIHVREAPMLQQRGEEMSHIGRQFDNLKRIRTGNTIYAKL